MFFFLLLFLDKQGHKCYNYIEMINMYKIVDIYWERVNLHLKLNKKISENVYLTDGLKKTELTSISSDEIVINVTNTPEGSMLEAGNFKIVIGDSHVIADEKLVPFLPDKSRIFPYRNGRYTYLVDFSLDVDMSLNIKIMFMMVNNKPKEFYRFGEASTIGGIIKILVSKVGIFCLNLFYKLVRFFKLSNRTILFMTDSSCQLVGNLKYLYDYIDKDKYKTVTYCFDRTSKSGFISLFKATFVIARSDIIFLDNYVQILTHINLSRNVKLVQLWHAGVGFKSVGYARFGLEGSPHPYKSCHRKYTSVVVDDDKLIPIYQEVFGCKSNVIHAFGMSRIDKYLQKNVIDEKCEYLYKLNSNLKTKKVILFSPTYRGSNVDTAYYDMNKIDLNKIGKFCKEKGFVFIIKMHPFIKEKIDIPSEYKNYIFDYSSFDINDLIYISDVMITDYSSCAYEYSLFNRPLIFYRYDKTIYEYLRPIHTVNMFTKKQYEVFSFEELMTVLERFNDIDVSKRFSNIKKSVNRNSCEQIINNL